MQLILSDTSSFDIDIIENRVWDELKRGYKHLQHVNIPYKPWDSPSLYMKKDRQEHVKIFSECAAKLDIQINRDLCLQGDQPHLNELHKIYEKNYDGNRDWLDFHETLHILELDTRVDQSKYNYISIDYRELGGPLNRKFNYNLIQESVKQVSPGDIFIRWQELGKKPYVYWTDKEPDNIQRLLELSKPWINLPHNFNISLDEIDFTAGRDLENFKPWWSKYKTKFCEHYNIPDWDTDQMFNVLVFGKVQDYKKIQNLVAQGAYPTRIKL